jgi:hypothetical protein
VGFSEETPHAFMNARKIIRNNNFLSELVRVIIFLSIDIDISTQYYGFGAQNSNKTLENKDFLGNSGWQPRNAASLSALAAS